MIDGDKKRVRGRIYGTGTIRVRAANEERLDAGLIELAERADIDAPHTDLKAVNSTLVEIQDYLHRIRTEEAAEEAEDHAEVVSKKGFARSSSDVAPKVTPKIEEAPKPPALAEWAMAALVAPGAAREAFLGDYNEHFHRNIEKRGVRWAKWMVYADAARSVWPLAWMAIKRLSWIAAILEWKEKVMG